MFLQSGTFWWALAKPSRLPILKSLASAVADVLKETFPAQGHANFFALCAIYDGFYKVVQCHFHGEVKNWQNLYSFI